MDTDSDKGPDDLIGKVVYNPGDMEVGVQVNVWPSEDDQAYDLVVGYIGPNGKPGVFEVDGYEPEYAPELQSQSDVGQESGWMMDWLVTAHLQQFEVGGIKEMASAIQEEATARRLNATSNLPLYDEVEVDGYMFRYRWERGRRATRHDPGDPGHPPVVVEKPNFVPVDRAQQVVEMVFALKEDYNAFGMRLQELEMRPDDYGDSEGSEHLDQRVRSLSLDE